MGILKTISLISLVFFSQLTIATEKYNPIKLFDNSGHSRAVSVKDADLTLVHFWATWCSACIHELPALLNLSSKFPDDRLQVVLIAADSKKNVNQFLKSQQIESTVLIDQYGKTIRTYNVKQLPVTIIYDSNENQLSRITGDADWLSLEMRQTLNHYFDNNN